MALTFDDGYFDNYTDAFTLARELRFPFSIFLCPGYIGKASRFWWFEGTYLTRHARVDKAVIDGDTYHLARSSEREALAHAIDARLRHARSIAERDAMLLAFRETLGMRTHTPSNATLEEQLARPLGWPEVHEMEASGWVSFGCHTLHHPVLSSLCDPEEVKREVSECRAVLERRLGHVVRAFAYPMGAVDDIGDVGLAAAREAEYDWALTMIPGFNTPHTDPHILRRIDADTSEPWWVLAWGLATQVAGGWTSPLHLLLVATRHIANAFRDGAMQEPRWEHVNELPESTPRGTGMRNRLLHQDAEMAAFKRTVAAPARLFRDHARTSLPRISTALCRLEHVIYRLVVVPAMVFLPAWLAYGVALLHSDRHSTMQLHESEEEDASTAEGMKRAEAERCIPDSA